MCPSALCGYRRWTAAMDAGGAAMHNRLMSSTGRALALALLLGTVHGAARAQGGEQGGGAHRPLVVERMGNFYVGGRVVTAPGTFDPTNPNMYAMEGASFHVDQLYADFLIPPNRRAYPLVMVHGGRQTGKGWESTPDGREGYQQIFTRRGFATYVVDFPRRGRAGYPSFTGNLGELLGRQVIPDSTLRYGDQVAFNAFRLGVWDERGMRFFPNTQFPRTPYALQQFFKQIVPAVEDDPEVITDALAALFRKIGPAVLLTHSQSGLFGWQTVLKAPRNVKAVVSYEPAAFLFPEGEVPEGGVSVSAAEFERLTRIPIQIVYGDNLPTTPSRIAAVNIWVTAVRLAREFVAAVNRHGGDASLLFLPDAGLRGNTHFPFSDLNNKQVADLLSEYLHRKGLDRRLSARAAVAQR
jgi:pimeloyl-ACP methyl ester carboxylesterase